MSAEVVICVVFAAAMAAMAAIAIRNALHVWKMNDLGEEITAREAINAFGQRTRRFITQPDRCSRCDHPIVNHLTNGEPVRCKVVHTDLETGYEDPCICLGFMQKGSR